MRPPHCPLDKRLNPCWALNPPNPPFERSTAPHTTPRPPQASSRGKTQLRAVEPAALPAWSQAARMASNPLAAPPPTPTLPPSWTEAEAGWNLRRRRLEPAQEVAARDFEVTRLWVGEAAAIALNPRVWESADRMVSFRANHMCRSLLPCACFTNGCGFSADIRGTMCQRICSQLFHRNSLCPCVFVRPAPPGCRHRHRRMPQLAK